MARQGYKSSIINVEWFNVTYKSVAMAVGTVLLLILGAGLYWYYFHSYGPREAAGEAIQNAERALIKTRSLESTEKIDRSRESAAVALNEAHSAFSFHNYETAEIAAIRSLNLSQQALSLAVDDGTALQLVRIVRLEGDVRVKRAGEFAWEAADRRQELRVGDQVKTASSGSAELIYMDGTVTRIEPGSLLEIRDLFEDPVTKVRRVRERLSWGEVTSSTRDQQVNGSYHEVSAGRVSARAVDAGEIRVAFDRQQKTSVIDVFKGTVEVETPDRREAVEAGERIRANASGQLGAKELLPGIPRLVSPSDERVFVHQNPRQLTLSLNWEEVPGAREYKLMIADQILFTNPIYDAIRKGTSAEIQGVDAGDYYWRVAAVSPGNVQGSFSAPRRFRVSSQVIRDRADTTPPEIRVTEFVQVGPMLIINGMTEPGANLWIDNEKIDVSEDGSFYSVVRLREEGVNEVRFVAQDNAGNEATTTRSTFVEQW